MHCKHRRARWQRKLWVAALFIFQGPAESLMLYGDALHCNHRSHWSLLIQFCLIKFSFSHKSQTWPLRIWSRDLKQYQNCRNSTFCMLTCAHVGRGKKEAGAMPRLITNSQAGKYCFLMHNWNASSWSDLSLTGGIHNTQSSHDSIPPTAANRGPHHSGDRTRCPTNFRTALKTLLCQPLD